MKPRYETEIAQIESEIAWLVDLFRSEHLNSFLEIGSRFGGSLWRLSQAFPKGSRIVSVDSGDGAGGMIGSRASLEACIRELNRIGYLATLFYGNSQASGIVSGVRTLGPYDALFIDGDHTLQGVTADWENYGPSAKIVAFHDIGWNRPEGHKGDIIDVPILWQSLKAQYPRHMEKRKSAKECGIGVLWRE